MNAKELYDAYLSRAKIAQIATVKNEQPWICTIWYVKGENGCLYWLSWPSRRHSQELSEQPKVAVAVAVQTEAPVIGVQMEGIAEEVTDEAEMAEVMQQYIATHQAGQKFMDNVRAGTNQHRMYRFTPRHAVLFDEVHFKGRARQEITLEGAK